MRPSNHTRPAVPTLFSTAQCSTVQYSNYTAEHEIQITVRISNILAPSCTVKCLVILLYMILIKPIPTQTNYNIWLTICTIHTLSLSPDPSPSLYNRYSKYVPYVQRFNMYIYMIYQASIPKPINQPHSLLLQPHNPTTPDLHRPLPPSSPRTFPDPMHYQSHIDAPPKTKKNQSPPKDSKHQISQKQTLQKLRRYATLRDANQQ